MYAVERELSALRFRMPPLSAVVQSLDGGEGVGGFV
jgi:hypothetical protein